MPQHSAPRVTLLLIVMLATACESEPSAPEPEPEPTITVDGFRILHMNQPIFEYHKGDPLEADTLHLFWPDDIVVRFLWLDGAGDSVDVGEHELIVTTPDPRFASWQGPGNTSLGVFETGGFPEVETSFRVRLVSGINRLLATPDLVLQVSQSE